MGKTWMIYRPIKDDHAMMCTHIVVPFKAALVLDKMRQQSFEVEPLQSLFYTPFPALILQKVLAFFQSYDCQDILYFNPTPQEWTMAHPDLLMSLGGFSAKHFYKSCSLYVILSCLHGKFLLSKLKIFLLSPVRGWSLNLIRLFLSVQTN